MRLIPALFIASLACATAACAREPKPMSNAAFPNDAFSNPDVAPLAQAVRQGDAAEIRRQLERVQAERDDRRRILPAEDAEDPALVVEMVVGLGRIGHSRARHVAALRQKAGI